MSRGADILANITYWTALVAASAGAFTAGFHYTHGATANVPVKQPVAVAEVPTPIPTASRGASPSPSPTPTLAPGPLPVPGSLPPSLAPGPADPTAQEETGFQTAAPVRNGTVEEVGAPPQTGAVYRVQVGAFDTREGALRQVEALQANGLNAVVVWDGGSFRAQLGAFADRERALSVADEVNLRGFPVTLRH